MASPTLEALLAVQDVDTDLDRHRHRRSHLPERAALAEVDQRLSSVALSGGPARGALAQVAGRQTGLEADLAATEKRITEVEKRLYSGEVTASRDLQAMADDIKTLQARRSELEDRVLELMDERQPHEEQVAAVDAELAQLNSDRERLSGEVAAATQVVDKEIAELTVTRSDRAAGVPPELLATYDKIRGKLGGVGVARLVGDRCDGCHLTLPSAEVARLHRLPEGEMATCEDCGRILVP